MMAVDKVFSEKQFNLQMELSAEIKKLKEQLYIWIIS